MKIEEVFSENPYQQFVDEVFESFGDGEDSDFLVLNSLNTIEEAEYQGREVELNKPFRLPSGSKKKFAVYVKNDKGNVIKVTFGDPNMKIKKSDPERKKSFRARHNCDNPGPKTKARYWSCDAW